VNKKDLKRFENRLMEEREKLVKNMERLESSVLNRNQKESSGDLSAYSFHMADLATDASEREKAFLFASKEGRLLYHIDEALRRIRRNEYGVCQNCKADISKERLEAVPHARLCINCKEEEEKAKQRR
jgi:RNA polymerase-binding protein DksA